MKITSYINLLNKVTTLAAGSNLNLDIADQFCEMICDNAFDDKDISTEEWESLRGYYHVGIGLLRQLEEMDAILQKEL